MSDAQASARVPKASGLRRALGANSGTIIAAIVFAILLMVVDWVGAGPLTYFDISFLSSGGATSAIAAIGQTIVIISGGFDLSAGAVISLVNVVDTDVYVEMSGGCQGCALSRATLRQGVERMLREAVPELTAVHDVTDHASGENPYL